MTEVGLNRYMEADTENLQAVADHNCHDERNFKIRTYHRNGNGKSNDRWTKE